MEAESTKSFELRPRQGGFSILIKPSRSSPYVFLALLAMVIIAWGLVNSLGNLGHDPEAPVGVVFLGSVEIALILVVLREVLRQEIIDVGPSTLTIKKMPRILFPFQPPKSYDAKGIAGLRPSSESGFKIGLPSQPGLEHGVITFDYQGESVSFAHGLEPDEAERLISIIVSRYPTYGAQVTSEK